MRWLIAVVALFWITTPVHASRKATLAVAPLKGDSDDAVANAIVDALAGKDFKVTGVHDTRAAMTKLQITGEPEGKSLTKLEARLEVDILVFGKVSKDGKKRTIHLKVAKGEEISTINLPYKSATEAWSRQLHDEVLANVGSGHGDEPVEQPKPHKHADEDDKPRKHTDDEPRPRKHDDDKPRRPVATEDDDTSVHKKHHRRDEAAPARRPGGSDLAIDGGLGFAQRHLSFTATAGTPPPTVGTGAASARVDAEVYPFALANPSSGLANFGLAATLDKTLGLSIQVPGTTNSASINQGHYVIGARYRINVGEQSTLVLGFDYATRHFLADRSALTSPTQLDAPDVDYASVAPRVSLRIPFSPEIVGFADVGALLIFAAGPIQSRDSYGPATAYGGELAIGGSYAVSKSLAVRVSAELSLIDLGFTGAGAMASARSVTSATDRSLGLAATLAYQY